MTWGGTIGCINGIGATRAAYRSGGAKYVPDPLKIYFDNQSESKQIMRYQKDQKISQFQLSEDKVRCTLSFWKCMSKIFLTKNHANSTAKSNLQGVRDFIYPIITLIDQV